MEMSDCVRAELRVVIVRARRERGWLPDLVGPALPGLDVVMDQRVVHVIT